MADIRYEARGTAADAVDQGRGMLARQKESAADRMEQVANAVRSGGRELPGGDGETGRYVEMAADRLESFGRQLREKDINGLIADMQDMARRSPAAFFGGSVLAGFMLARFMKSSSSPADDSTGHAQASDSADAGEQGWSHPKWSASPEDVSTPSSFTGSDVTGGRNG